MRHATPTVPKICCSYVCKNIYQRRRQKTKGTDIERLMLAAFAGAGVAYEFQFPVPRICTADFYLPATHTIVFCDGDYWHSLPDHIARDNRQTAALQKRGYRVVRFLGSAIKADPEACAAVAARLSTSGTSGSASCHP